MRNWESDKALLESDEVLHEISIQMFKTCSNAVWRAGKKVFRTSLSTGVFPDWEKIKRIISPLFLKRETCHWEMSHSTNFQYQ